MTILVTNGWDLMALAGEPALNRLLAALYNAGAFPTAIKKNVGGLIDIDAKLGVPTVDLAPAGMTGGDPMVTLSMPITGTATILGSPNTIPPNTAISVTTDLVFDEIDLTGKKDLKLTLDLTSKRAIFALELDTPGTPPAWVLLLNAALQVAMQSADFAKPYFLGTVTVPDAATAIEPTGSVFFSVLVSSPVEGPGINMLALLGTSSTGSKGSLVFPVPAAGTYQPVTDGDGAALYVSNRCLLDNIVLPSLASNLEQPLGAFSFGLSTTAPSAGGFEIGVSSPIALPGDYNPQLTGLRVYVNDSGQVQGDLTIRAFPVSGLESGIWVDATGSFYLSPSLAGDVIQFKATLSSLVGTVHIEAWVWVLIALLLGAIGGVPGLEAAVLTAVLKAIVDRFQFDVSVNELQAKLQGADISFTWPAQKTCPITAISLRPGDFRLGLDPLP